MAIVTTEAATLTSAVARPHDIVLDKVQLLTYFPFSVIVVFTVLTVS